MSRSTTITTLDRSLTGTARPTSLSDLASSGSRIERASIPSASAGERNWFPPIGTGVSRRDVVSFTAQLAIMTRTGVDVAGALQSLARQRPADRFAEVLQQVQLEVLAGSSLSQALTPHSHIFGAAFIATVAAGEASGRLPDVLQQLTTLLRGELKLRNSVRAMLAYPLVLTVVSISVLIATVVFVLPRFEAIFADFEAPLPLITRMLLGVSNELHAHWWAWLPATLGSVAGLAFFLRTESGHAWRDWLLLSAQPVRAVTRSLLIGRTCRLLGIMLLSGVPLVETLRMVRSAIKNSLYQQLFDHLEQEVLNGRGFSGAFAECEFVPLGAAEMIATAERTGALGSVAVMLGEHFEEEGEAKLRELVSVVEPALTVLLGVGVAIMVMSVLFPLFDLSSAVKRH